MAKYLDETGLQTLIALIKAELSTKADVDALAGLMGFNTEVVTALPTTTANISTSTIYFVAKAEAEAETGNIYNEYLYINGNWELIGTTDVQLTAVSEKEAIAAFIGCNDYDIIFGSFDSGFTTFTPSPGETSTSQTYFIDTEHNNQVYVSNGSSGYKKYACSINNTLDAPPSSGKYVLTSNNGTISWAVDTPTPTFTFDSTNNILDISGDV